MVVTSSTITQVIAAGARTTKAVAQATSAGSDCGRCVTAIARMVREQTTAEPAGSGRCHDEA
jgi:bacterioferritin-associated ferredoxin